MAAFVTITDHTTTSKPNPHVVYIVEVSLNGSVFAIERRYSEFTALHGYTLYLTLSNLASHLSFVADALCDEFPFPPKRFLVTSLFPSAWIDDALIAERKAGLAKYLSALLWSPDYQNSDTFLDFLNRPAFNPKQDVDVEDYLPSTLSRKKTAETLREFNALKQPAEGFVSSAYYPEWCATSVPPEALDYKRFDILFFGFVTPNESSTLDWGLKTASVLKRVVDSANVVGAGTNIVLSIGGWEGSQWFSNCFSTAVNRMIFVDAVVTVVKKYGLSGVDIDWEFPNSKGFGNPYSPEDTAKFLLFLTSLRSALGPSKIISATVGHLTWLGADGLPLPDVSAFAAQLSYINIMNYSTSPTSLPGSNAPLGNPLSNAKQLRSTAKSAIDHWSTAGFPVSKMLLGLAFFGFVFRTKKTSLFANSSTSEFACSVFNGAHKEIPGRAPMKALSSQMSLAYWWGKQIPFKSIVQSGALVKRFDGNYGQGDGFTLAWDDSSSTPYLYNTRKRTLITFDNTRSLAAKVKFAQGIGMAGCCAWSLDQDDGYTLQDVIRAALGK